jgi:hypothetical protein
VAAAAAPGALVVEVIDRLDLSELEKSYRGSGSAPKKAVFLYTSQDAEVARGICAVLRASGPARGVHVIEPDSPRTSR